MSSKVVKVILSKDVPKGHGKPWVKPAVSMLRIDRDSFSGSVLGVEGADKAGLPAKI